MPFGNYAELQTEIAQTLRRTSDSMVPRIQGFIQLFEARVRRELPMRQGDVRATTTTLERYIPLPADYLMGRNFQVNGPSGHRILEYAPAAWLDQHVGDRTGRVRWYTIVGNSIQLAPAPSAEEEGEGVELEMSYYAFPGLSDTTPTNWLLQLAPDVYLHGALVHGFAYLADEARAAAHDALVVRGFEELKRLDANARRGEGPLVMRSGIDWNQRRRWH